MKQIKNIFRTICVLAVALQAATSARADNARQPVSVDSVEVSLLTCSPHEEVYSLYGHSALRWHDTGKSAVVPHEDIVFNWGMFNFNKPFFVLRFVFGLTDYELGVAPYDSFCAYYQRWGSSVTEQVLNLTNEEKLTLRAALMENLQPENRVYRYNFFYDNCSTRPRDLVERCLKRQLTYKPREDYQPTYRDMVHECVRHHPWARFGNDMLLGIRADLKTDLREQEFLPENLMIDFDRAVIYDGGRYEPLVKRRSFVVEPGVQVIESDFPLTPMQCAWLLLAVSLMVWTAEWRLHRIFVWWDVTLMLLQGLAGCVLFVMLFSQHPATSTNLQLLLLNPLPLFFIPQVARRRQTRWWRWLLILTLLFLIGSIWQQYAEGMIILALCLLLRVLKKERMRQ